jgi:hypothetical protein
MRHRRLRPLQPEEKNLRVYTLCFFDIERALSRVQMLDALTDEEAVAFASSTQIFQRREVWDHHRLVATLPPTR